jgi:hypothetical protein
VDAAVVAEAVVAVAVGLESTLSRSTTACRLGCEWRRLEAGQGDPAWREP